MTRGEEAGEAGGDREPRTCPDCLGVGRVIDVYAADDESTRSCGQCFGTGLQHRTSPGSQATS